MFRLGYDAKRVYQNNTGLGNYSRTLLRHLAKYYPRHKYHLFAPDQSSTKARGEFFKQKNYEVHRYSGGARFRSFKLGRNAASFGVQLFHGLSNELPFDIGKSGMASVVTVHDLIFLRHPRLYPWLDRQLYNVKCRFACKQADCVVAVSEHTKQDICELYKIPEEKVLVVHQTCDDLFRKKVGRNARMQVKENYLLPEEFLLYVGSLNDRKGVLDFLLAWSRLPLSIRIPIVIVGTGRKRYIRRIKRLLKKQDLNQYVYWLGNARNRDLPAIYRLAKAFVYPSVYEGFGIPIIEALYCHTPVLTTRSSALPEAAGPGALYAEPGDAGSLLLKLTELLESQSLRQKLAREGQNYVRQQFDPERVTKEMMSVYEKLL